MDHASVSTAMRVSTSGGGVSETRAPTRRAHSKTFGSTPPVSSSSVPFSSAFFVDRGLAAFSRLTNAPAAAAASSADIASRHARANATFSARLIGRVSGVHAELTDAVARKSAADSTSADFGARLAKHRADHAIASATLSLRTPSLAAASAPKAGSATSAPSPAPPDLEAPPSWATDAFASSSSNAYHSSSNASTKKFSMASMRSSFSRARCASRAARSRRFQAAYVGKSNRSTTSAKSVKALRNVSTKKLFFSFLSSPTRRRVSVAPALAAYARANAATSGSSIFTSSTLTIVAKRAASASRSSTNREHRSVAICKYTRGTASSMRSIFLNQFRHVSLASSRTSRKSKRRGSVATRLPVSSSNSLLFLIRS
mmetsp:Transcript_12247/g.52635  ORF Transcript_12247/g.52635 Transcript_12247/m.52635 type:complete len:372 (+) Transcript_12247:567-1682(+)